MPKQGGSHVGLDTYSLNIPCYENASDFSKPFTQTENMNFPLWKHIPDDPQGCDFNDGNVFHLNSKKVESEESRGFILPRGTAEEPRTDWGYGWGWGGGNTSEDFKPPFTAFWIWSLTSPDHCHGNNSKRTACAWLFGHCYTCFIIQMFVIG